MALVYLDAAFDLRYEIIPASLALVVFFAFAFNLYYLSRYSKVSSKSARVFLLVANASVVAMGIWFMIFKFYDTPERIVSSIFVGIVMLNIYWFFSDLKRAELIFLALLLGILLPVNGLVQLRYDRALEQYRTAPESCGEINEIMKCPVCNGMIISEGCRLLFGHI